MESIGGRRSRAARRVPAARTALARLARRAPVALAVLLAGCAAPGSVAVPAPTTSTTSTMPADTTEASGITLPDISMRPVSRDDLAVMLPDGFTVVAERSNGDLVTRAGFDTDDEAADVVGFGRETGIAATGAVPAGEGRLWIDLLGDGDAAHGYLLDTAGDIVKRTGGTHDPAIGAVTAEEFPVMVGEEAIGLVLEQTDGTHTTAVLFRLGRLVLFASIAHAEGADLRVPVQYLAEDLATAAIAALTATPVAPATPAEPAHRFETTLRIEDAAGTAVVYDVVGTIDGANLACTIRVAGPDGSAATTLTRVGGAVWVDTGGGAVAVGGGNLTVAPLLALCPAWPLAADAAGLGGLRTGATTRHHLNGVDATGYTADLAGLSAATGLPLPGVAVDSFSFWVADDAPWVVEIGFIATGPDEALAGLLPPDHGLTGTLRSTVRHRVLDLGAAGPVVPPDQTLRAELP